jgi:hypothetical protein
LSDPASKKFKKSDKDPICSPYKAKRDASLIIEEKNGPSLGNMGQSVRVTGRESLLPDDIKLEDAVIKAPDESTDKALNKTELEK